MALNSSGPISLAGTTTGQSIEKELGGNGTTQISLNDTAVRTLAGVPSGAITMPTNFWGKSNMTGWINEAVPSVTYGLFYNSTSDSTYYYVYGLASQYNCGNSVDYQTIAKYTLTGTAVYNKQLYQPGQLGWNSNNYAMTIDTSSNIYIFPKPRNGGVGAISIIKYDSGGTLLSQKQLLYTSPISNFNPQRAFVDSSGDLVVAGHFIYLSCSGNYYYPFLAKYNATTGAQIYAYYATAARSMQWQQSATIDSAGYLWMSGGGGSTNENYVTRWNPSTGALAMIKKSATVCCNPYYIFGGVATDSSNNAYFWSSNSYSSSRILVKMNSSGAVQWGRRVTATGSFQLGGQLCSDSSDNIYAAWQDTTSNAGKLVIVKYNSSGVLQWQRNLYPNVAFSNRYINCASLKVINGYLYVTGSTLLTTGSPGPSYGFNFVAPTDGSKTGTYVVNGTSFIYAASSYTEASATYPTMSTPATTTAAITAPTITTLSFTATSNIFTNYTTTF